MQPPSHHAHQADRPGPVRDNHHPRQRLRVYRTRPFPEQLQPSNEKSRIAAPVRMMRPNELPAAPPRILHHEFPHPSTPPVNHVRGNCMVSVQGQRGYHDLSAETGSRASPRPGRAPQRCGRHLPRPFWRSGARASKADPSQCAGDPDSAWRGDQAWSDGGMRLCGGGKGDGKAGRLDPPDVVAELAVDIGAGLVVAVAEVGVPGNTRPEQTICATRTAITYQINRNP